MSRWRKVRTVARFEFLCTVKSKGWLIGTFGMPVFLLAYAGIVSIPGYFLAKKGTEVAVHGVLDEARALALSGEVKANPFDEMPLEVRAALEAAGQKDALDRAFAAARNIVFRPFASHEEARAALRAGLICGYFRIPQDWLATGVVELYETGAPDLNEGRSSARRALAGLLAARLLEGRVPEEIGARARTPISETRGYTLSPEGQVIEGGVAGRVVRIVIPIAFTVLLIVSILMSAGSLVQATGIEKENRVVEVLLSSAEPDQILLGKLFGLGAAGTIQMVVWFAMVGVTGIALTATLASLGVEVPWLAMATAVVLFVVAYLFFGSLMLGSGSLGANARESQQFGMIWTLFAVIPMLFLMLLLDEPQGALARAFTWIPFTAPTTVVLRLAIDPTGIAWWEVVGSLLVLLASTWFAIRLAARLFRVGMLLTGARPKLRQLIRQARLSR